MGGSAKPLCCLPSTYTAPLGSATPYASVHWFCPFVKLPHHQSVRMPKSVLLLRCGPHVSNKGAACRLVASALLWYSGYLGILKLGNPDILKAIAEGPTWLIGV